METLEKLQAEKDAIQTKINSLKVIEKLGKSEVKTLLDQKKVLFDAKKLDVISKKSLFYIAKNELSLLHEEIEALKNKL